jgi:16S rRNA G966 N2-methylase RsmD
VLCVDAVHGLEILSREQVNRTPEATPGIVFLDPPYGNSEDYDRVVSFLGFTTLLGEGSLVIAEHRRNFELPELAGKLHRVRVLRQGDAVLSFYRFVAQNSESVTNAQ